MADGEPPTATEIEQVIRRWPEVSDLFSRHVRLALSRPAHQQWELFALSCLARAHHAVQSVFILDGRGPDCAVLARVLYDHVVTFVWLLANPEQHYLEQLSYEHEERIKLRNEMLKHAPVPASRDALELALISSGWNPKVKSAPPVFEKARQADKHWNKALPVMNFAFARDYGGNFRNYSAYIHPRVVGVVPFATCDGVPSPDTLKPFALVQIDAMMTFVRALMIATKLLHSMSAEDVARACSLEDAEPENA